MMEDTKPSKESIYYVRIPVIPVDDKIDKMIEEYFTITDEHRKKARIRKLNERMRL